MPTKLERLLEKEAQLKAQIQQAKAAERTLEKKRDTRRKILIGAAVMARVESGRWPKADLLEMMDGFLSRPHERDLFELDERGDDEAKTNSHSTAGAKASKADAVAGSDSQTAIGKVSTARKKAAKEKLRVQRENAAQQSTRTKQANGSRSRLAEPDFDVEEEFNL